MTLSTSPTAGDAERARHDGDMAGRAAFLEHQAAQLRAVVVEQRRRPHRARDEDGVVAAAARARGAWSWPDQLAQQPVGEIVEVVQPLAQIGIGLRAACGRGCRTARARPRPRR